MSSVSHGLSRRYFLWFFAALLLLLLLLLPLLPAVVSVDMPRSAAFVLNFSYTESSATAHT
jgi:hypothetical protein